MMEKLYRLISKTPNYIRRYGTFHGLRLLLQIERDLPSKSQVVRSYALPGFPAPIHLRASVSDHAIFWQVLVMCQYDFRRFPQSDRLMAAFREQVRRGDRPLIIDCGGNVGLASVWFATQFPEAVVYAVEPDSENFEMLKKNTACFGTRVTPLKGGIWHEKGFLRITNPSSGAAALRVEADTGSTDKAVRAYTIQEICALAGTDSPFIVKIDIEGAQGSLFKGNTQWLSGSHLVVLELDDWLMPWQGTSRPFFASISRYPFDYLLGGESIFCFRDFAAERPPGAESNGGSPG